MHYYVGGSLGGFYLVACWQYGQWHGVLAGGMALYILIYILCWRLHRCTLVKKIGRCVLKETDNNHSSLGDFTIFAL